MSYVVLLLVSVGVTIYALVDCWRSTDDEVRGLPRAAWVLLIILVGPLGIPPFGAAAYLFFGRPTGLPRSTVLAPDDDPDFLHQLDQQRRREENEERRREQRERKERDRQERQHRKDTKRSGGEGAGGAGGAGGPEATGGGGHPLTP